MKFILLSVVCLLGAVVAKPAETKQKRDILRGDPRYGTDYHLNHRHVHHDSNEVEVSRALGGYVGSYSVPENSAYQNNVNLQPRLNAYGPPNFSPGQPIGAAQQQVQASSVNQGSDISNFKTAENVETVSNGYRSPVVDSTQSTSEPTYQPVDDAAQGVVEKTVVEKTVQTPIDSYGTPIPAYGVPAVETTAPNEVTVQHDVVHQDIPAQAHVEADAQAVVKAVPTQAPVNHVHQTAQPAVQHHVLKTAQHSAQPAVPQNNLFQQTAQFPQFYSSGYSGNLGGALNGFQNFGSLDSGFQTYGTPSFGAVTPQVYSSDFSNFGFGFPQDLNANVYQGGYSAGQLQQFPQSFGQTQQSAVSQFPQGQNFGQTQQGAVSQFPQGQNFGQTQQGAVSQFPQGQNFGQSHQGAVGQFPQGQNFGQTQQSTVGQLPQGQNFGQTQQGTGSQFPQGQNFVQTRLGAVDQFPQGQNFGQTHQNTVGQFPQGQNFGQTHQNTVSQFPQVTGFGQTQQDAVNQFPQFNTFGQNQLFPGFPNFVSGQVSQFPGFPGIPGFPQAPAQGAQQPAPSAVNGQSDSISTTNVNAKQVQPAAVQVNTHSNAASSTTKPPVVRQAPSSGGYVY